MNEQTMVIIGASGQLSKALQNRYPGARAIGSKDLNIADATAVAAFDWHHVKIILNAAGYTNVDGAETTEGRVAAWRVNAVGVANLAVAALQHDLLVVHISTDYVFDGTRNNHAEDEPFSPLGVYAQSKAAGDIAASLVPRHYTLRTSWVIGDGRNFVRTMLELGQKGTSPTVVADQVGRLTFTSELVRAIDHLLTTSAAYGVYNVSNGGTPASWADISRAIFETAGYDSLTVTDTTTADYYADKPGIAPRPLYSTLNLAKVQATGFQPIDWREALGHYIAQEAHT